MLRILRLCIWKDKGNVFVFLLLCFLFFGCAHYPGGWENQTENLKVTYTIKDALNPFTLGGMSKTEIAKRFGNPSAKETYLDKSELWVYKNTREGNTIKFAFNQKGVLKSICFNSRIINVGSYESEDLARKALEEK